MTSSSRDSRLSIDFFESGNGDTIIVTFPSGGIGIIDAHPSPNGLRPSIKQLVHGKTVHFVCLTHPHADHGIDLIPVLKEHPVIEAFWHTTSDIVAFCYRVEELPNYPSSVRDFAKQMTKDWADFLLDLFGALAERTDIEPLLLRADMESCEIDGVRIHFLSPEPEIQARFLRA